MPMKTDYVFEPYCNGCTRIDPVAYISYSSGYNDDGVIIVCCKKLTKCKEIYKHIKGEGQANAKRD